MSVFYSCIKALDTGGMLVRELSNSEFITV